ncbi:MAG: hypothetical protein HY902_20900 [Deltaproteobacteria bacterium]|nr:hypothetical protein [Deltaproteobacteria bacterium]
MVWVWALAAVATAAPAQAATPDLCVDLKAANPELAALASEYERQSNENPQDAKLIWLAASAYRCAAQEQSAPAQRCIQVGQAKALYDKFADTAGSAKALKRELTDAKRTAEALRAGHAEPCATLALQTAKAGQAGAAAQLFESVYILTPRPLLLFNAARACELGGLPNEAAVYYMAYLALPLPWRDRRDAVAKLVQIQRTLASDTGDLLKRAEQTATNAYQWAQQANATAGNAQKQAAAAQQTANGADQRARAAEQRAGQAEQRAGQAEQRAAQADQRAQSTEHRAAQAETRVQAGESRSQTAADRAQSASDRAAQAELAVRQMAQRLAAAEAEIRDLRNQLAAQAPRR